MNNSRKLNFLFALAPFAAAVAGFNSSAAETITVTSFGGAYGKSQIEAHHKPFVKKSGNTVLSEDYNGGLAQVRAQVKTGSVTWDAMDVELAEQLRGCDEGLFERVDVSKLAPAPDGTPAAQDFIKGSLQKCAVGTIIWSNIVAYDKAKYITGGAPKTIQDFFDLKKFPGKRGMKKEPQVNIEWALMADGVPADKVYEVLDTPQGLDRAFKKLDTIKPSVVWWQAGAQAPQLLADKEVVMTSAYHGRIYDAIVNENKPFAMIWDGNVRIMDMYAMVKGTKHLATANEFIRFATSPQALADQTKYVPYGPVRKSSMKLVDPKIVPYLPTAPQNSLNYLSSDAGWWADHSDEINQKFAVWLSK